MNNDVTCDNQIILPTGLTVNCQADTALLTALKTGDENAFRQIYLTWHKPVVVLMHRITRSMPDAEDIAQDVFAHVWTNRERIDPTKNIRGLIFIIARRLAVNLSRRVKRFDDYLSCFDGSDDMGNNPDELLQARETHLLIQIAIRNMPHRQREVFELYYNENKTSAEIAERFGLTQSNVQKHIYNAKKYLEGILAMILLLLSK